MSFYKKYPWIFMSAFISAVILALYFITAGISIPFLVPAAKGSVVASSKNCSRIGGEMLEMGGSVADAAIAALLCEGVSIPALSGLGGGFIMMLYISHEDISVLNALGYAPEGVTKDMFYNEKGHVLGPKSILVPGELKGYGELHKKYGKLQWSDLFQPSIDLCKDGVEITEFHHKILMKHEETIRNSKYLSSVFLDERTNKVLNVGQVFRQPIMAKTLTTIANEGSDTMYEGTISKKILQDIPDMLVTKKDLKNFSVKWHKPLKSILQSGHMLFVPNIPTSGSLLAYCFNILREWITSDVFSFTNWAYIVESFKLMFAVRGLLEDSDGGVISSYQISSLSNIKKTIYKIHPNTTSQDYKFYGAEFMTKIKDSQTTHISILSALGNGISVTSTINSIFGSGVVSESTGIILNNEMDDFTTRPMPNLHGIWAFQNNTIAPKKQPMHSICPVMILNRDLSVRMVLGATGGARILTSIAQVILKHLIFNMELQTSVNEYRLHHQLMPMELYLDELYKNDPKIINFFTKIKHNISYFETEGLDIVTAISNTTKLGIVGVTDIRRGEETAAYLLH